MATEDKPLPSEVVALESISFFDGKYYNFEVKRPRNPLKGKSTPGKRRLDDAGTPEFNQILPIGTKF